MSEDPQARTLDATGGTSTAGPPSTPSTGAGRRPINMNRAIRDGLSALRGGHVTDDVQPEEPPPPRDPDFGRRSPDLGNQPRTVSDQLRAMFDARPRASGYHRIGGA